MRLSPLENKIKQIIEPVIEDLGFGLVSIKSFGEGGHHTIQIMAENPETGRLGVDDCSKISREVSAVMDVEDPIEGRYKLEVSSPGIDRPLIKFDDYKRYCGFELKVEIDPPLETGQKRFRGTIQSVNKEDDSVLILTDENQEVEFDVGRVSKAKLVLTEALIKYTAEQKKI